MSKVLKDLKLILNGYRIELLRKIFMAYNNYSIRVWNRRNRLKDYLIEECDKCIEETRQ